MSSTAPRGWRPPMSSPSNRIGARGRASGEALRNGQEAETGGQGEEARRQTLDIFRWTDHVGLSDVWQDDVTGAVLRCFIPQDALEPERRKGQSEMPSFDRNKQRRWEAALSRGDPRLYRLEAGDDADGARDPRPSARPRLPAPPRTSTFIDVRTGNGTAQVLLVEFGAETDVVSLPRKDFGNGGFEQFRDKPITAQVARCGPVPECGPYALRSAALPRDADPLKEPGPRRPPRQGSGLRPRDKLTTTGGDRTLTGGATGAVCGAQGGTAMLSPGMTRRKTTGRLVRPEGCWNDGRSCRSAARC